MKKQILMILAMGTSVLFAQKPDKGTITTEAGVAMSSFMSNVNSLGLNGRYFLSPTLAVTLGVNYGSAKIDNHIYENSDGTGNKGTTTTTISSNAIVLGVQKHFQGTSKLSPFVGATLGIGGAKNKVDMDKTNGSTYMSNYSSKMEQSGSNMNVAIQLGFDYWFTDGLFVGIAVFPVQWSSMNFKDGKTTVTTGATTNTTVAPGAKFSTLSTSGALPTFRLGWRF